MKWNNFSQKNFIVIIEVCKNYARAFNPKQQDVGFCLIIVKDLLVIRPEDEKKYFSLDLLNK